MKLVFLLAVCAILLVLGILLLATSPSRTLPKTIWTYWDSEDLPKSIQYCMSTWRKYNKDHDIIFLTKNNINSYLPDFDISTFRHADSSARISDCIRLNVLATYGGIWMDASMICNRSLDWVHQTIKDKEFLGYYISAFTQDPKYPVIESWFFACVPQSPFVIEWRDAFMRMNKYDTVNDYVDALESLGTDPQGINETLRTYLAIHLAAQYVLQVLKYPTSDMTLLRCEDGPFLYLERNDWNSEAAVEEVLQNRVHTDLIKLRGDERKILDQYFAENL